MVDLGAMDRVLDADTSSGLVSVEGGITLHALGKRLAELGLAMENQGDIDSQTLAGAISTATHGTGARYRNISSQVDGHPAGDGGGPGDRAHRGERSGRAGRGARGCRLAGGDRLGHAARGPDLHDRAHRRPARAGRHARAARRAGRRARPFRVLRLPLRRRGAHPHQHAQRPPARARGPAPGVGARGADREPRAGPDVQGGPQVPGRDPRDQPAGVEPGDRVA